MLKKSMAASAVALMICCVAASAQATIYVDATPSGDADDFESTLVADGIRRGLVAGAYDRMNVVLPVQSRGGVGELHVTAASFARQSSGVQNAIVETLASFHRESWADSYEVTVNTAANDLGSVAFFATIGRDVGALGEQVPAEQLLSDYAKTWAYQMSRDDGPNCWHTSLASTNRGWSKHRYMSGGEFHCHMFSTYEQLDVTSLDELQFGDVIRLADSSGGEVHGFVYLGPDSSDPSRHIVFTKNGYAQSEYLFQTFDTVANEIYPGNEVSYFRSTGRSVDPSEPGDSRCEDEFEAESTLGQSLVDPIVRAGLRRTDLRSLAPIVVD